MKIYLHLIFLILLLSLFNCKETTNKKVNKIEKQTEAKKRDIHSKSLKKPIKKTVYQKHYEYLYVSAKSGLKYRDKPKGKVLGKFPLNTYLTVIEYPKILGKISDNNKVLKGEWIGIKSEMDTVYVFNAFLSQTCTFSDIKIYQSIPFHKENNGRTGFLNLSESFFNSENSILFDRNLKKNTIRLNAKQRKSFLDRTNISELDSVFIYDINSKLISSFIVKNLPAIARINIYFDEYNQSYKDETDYEFGLDLGNNYNGSWENFTYIGNHNPFQEEKLKPIIWKKVDTKLVHSTLTKVKNLFSHNFSELKFETSFLYKQDNMDYYILNKNRLIVIDQKEKSVVFNKIYYEGEGCSLNMLKMENDSLNNNYNQWTGKLFKDKPSIIFGFQYFSFGCEKIDFLAENEPPIQILCDNRH